jgi:hypothetical protein
MNFEIKLLGCITNNALMFASKELKNDKYLFYLYYNKILLP